MPKMYQTVDNIAIYLRISKDDGDREESESISNQRRIILEYINDKFKYSKIEEFIDDGYSGSNFRRPAFKRMITKIKKKEIDLVVTKNLARFGRSYLESGYYIEKMFLDCNTRYIAILDNVDNYEDMISNDFAPIRGVFNEMYCKETSKSVKASKRRRMHEGVYACNTAPFGYKKDSDNLGQLVIDDKVAYIIKDIFNKKLEGETIVQITDYLNKKKVITPNRYLNIKGLENIKNKDTWKTNMVNRILCNQVYIGNTIRGKTKKISYKSEKRIHIKRENCIITENTHDAIISKKVWDSIHNSNKYGMKQKKAPIETLLDDLIYCGVCNGKMYKRRAREKKILVKCYSNSLSKTLCKNENNYHYDEIENRVINEITNYYKKNINTNELKRKLYNKYNKIQIKELEDKIKENNQELAKLNFTINKIYSQRLDGGITDDEYKERYTKHIAERKELNKLNEDYQNEIHSIIEEKNSNTNRKVKNAMKKVENREYTKEDIQTIIKQIKVNKNDIELEFNFKEL